MASLPTQPTCPAQLGCGWTSHRRKHFPFKGMTKADTLHEPSRYRSGMTAADIRQLETETVRHGARTQRENTVSEYQRDVDRVIGWDRGKDAITSFVECSGGEVTGRAFHGRPMAADNRKLKKS